jgi:hypothetical protein
LEASPEAGKNGTAVLTGVFIQASKRRTRQWHFCHLRRG